MPGLRDLVQAEIARRSSAPARAFWFIVDDEPDAISDADVAIKLIVERADTGAATLVAPAIADAVHAALQKAYPRRWAISHVIVDPNRGCQPRPDVPSQDDDVADAALARAQDRIAKLRGESR